MNSRVSLASDLEALGLARGMIVMVHSSLSQIGWTEGGADTVIRALREVLGNEGTLVMPAFSPSAAQLPPYDPATTPTTMGAIPEHFRGLPGTLRSSHPLGSVTASGPRAGEITGEHALEFGDGRDTPFEKLYRLGAHTLLLGVGWNRCTSLHHAESLTPNRRTMPNRFPMRQAGGGVVWVDVTDQASDNGLHFPIVGARFEDIGQVRTGPVGKATARLFPTRAIVDFAAAYFRANLPRS